MFPRIRGKASYLGIPVCDEDLGHIAEHYDRFRHVVVCNGNVLDLDEDKSERHERLYYQARGIVARMDWAMKFDRERYGKKPIPWRLAGGCVNHVKQEMLIRKNMSPGCTLVVATRDARLW